MDTYLIPITLGLLVMCGVLAWLAERARHETQQIQGQLDQATARAGKQRQLAYNDGLFEGWKRGWSESYTSACKAERAGLNASEAIHRLGKLNAPALLEAPETDPIVKVLNTV
jgi:hypothetical protein